MKVWKAILGVMLTVGVVWSTGAYAAAASEGDAKAAAGPAEKEGTTEAVPTDSTVPTEKAPPEKSAKSWNMKLAMYAWLSSMSSTTEKRHRETVSEFKFEDLLEVLDFAGFAYFEAQRGNWRLFSELDFVKLSDDNEVRLKRMPLAHVNTDGCIKQTMLELGAMRSFDRNRVGFDVLAGARYTRAVVDAKFGRFDFDTTDDYVDPFVGGRLRVQLSEKWDTSLRADVGGFGVGSDLTTQAIAAVHYQISERYSLGFGYRYLRIEDDSNGSDSTDETYGPAIGMAINF